MTSSLKNSEHQSVRSVATSARGMLSASAAVAAGTIAAVFLSGGTYALWNGQEQVGAANVTSGSLTITATESFDDSLFTNMLVGEKVRQNFTIANTGTTDVTLSASATASSAFEVRLASGSCTAAIAGASATASAANLGSLGAGATQTYCLEVTAAAAAQPGNSAPIVATITAGQN